MADTQNTNVQEQDIHQLLKVKREKLANLQQAGKDPFQITKYDVTHHSTDIKNSFEELEGKTVRIAGRVMSKRVMGKASFCNVQDLPGNIQVYVARDSIGEESYADFKKYDVGDIVGIEDVQRRHNWVGQQIQEVIMLPFNIAAYTILL